MCPIFSIYLFTSPPLMISRFLRLSTYIAVFHVDQLEPYLWIIVSSLDLSEIWVH